MELIKIDKGLRKAVTAAITETWGSSIIITRGKIHNTDELDGYVAMEKDSLIGIITYYIYNLECEVISLDSFKENRGVGTSLLNTVINDAKVNNCRRIFLITTNDNTSAMRFYQKRGFDFAAMYHNAIEKSRELKPQIPQNGFEGIPIKHEIEFELVLK
ncbi:GNAT family N-acetyltransferase [Anaerocolumna sp. AGMB13020]|uniref:GNAT family N-acetyltransferase n=1 Tax=Anaerocolumna sp. AGMB13020 TaxID=3081750 RepID=UPI0029531BC7|nr:GNAT family N-acetyltransferase [Anaerocolumna sp. AGMB13020]WOO37309.1 GNAT family N-acetyltransferase [Anaerocolumna sp. AGMB13020]